MRGRAVGKKWVPNRDGDLRVSGEKKTRVESNESLLR